MLKNGWSHLQSTHIMNLSGDLLSESGLFSLFSFFFFNHVSLNPSIARKDPVHLLGLHYFLASLDSKKSCQIPTIEPPNPLPCLESV